MLQNKTVSEHQEKFNEDSKLVEHCIIMLDLPIEIESRFPRAREETRLLGPAVCVGGEVSHIDVILLIYPRSQSIEMNKELEVLRNTT